MIHGDTQGRRVNVKQSTTVALGCLMVAVAAAGAVPKVGFANLTVDSRIGDLVNHPAFAGFADRILPRSDLEVDRDARLSTMASLLPYHEHVDPREVVRGLNRLIDDASAGRQVFFDFCTEAEKQCEPSKAQTGLFFLRGQPR